MSEALPDIVADGLQVIFCGINPGATAAVAGHHFVNRSNRFWRVLHLSGFTPHEIQPEDDKTILRYGCGLTAAVARPTRSAGELSRQEMVDAGTGLRAKIAHLRPRTVAFLGKPAFAAITAAKDVAWGVQPEPFAGAVAWVLPNPSGLNRGFTQAQLVTHYRALRDALPAARAD